MIPVLMDRWRWNVFLTRLSSRYRDRGAKRQPAGDDCQRAAGGWLFSISRKLEGGIRVALSGRMILNAGWRVAEFRSVMFWGAIAAGNGDRAVSLLAFFHGNLRLPGRAGMETVVDAGSKVYRGLWEIFLCDASSRRLHRSCTALASKEALGKAFSVKYESQNNAEYYYSILTTIFHVLSSFDILYFPFHNVTTKS